jgi:hypothetical protein
MARSADRVGLFIDRLAERRAAETAHVALQYPEPMERSLVPNRPGSPIWRILFFLNAGFCTLTLVSTSALGMLSSWDLVDLVFYSGCIAAIFGLGFGRSFGTARAWWIFLATYLVWSLTFTFYAGWYLDLGIFGQPVALGVAMLPHYFIGVQNVFGVALYASTLALIDANAA